MACRGLYVFSHESELGNAPAHALFDLVDVSLRDGISVPRQFSDYIVTVDKENMPEGVELIEML